MKTTFSYITILFCYLTFSCFAYAQNPWVDSVKNAAVTEKADSNRINALLNLSSAYRFTYPDSGLVWAQQALAISQKLNDDKAIFWSIALICNNLYPSGNYALLELDYAFKLLPVAAKLNTPYSRGFPDGIISDAYYNLGEYKTSLEYWRKVMAIAEREVPGELAAIYCTAIHIFVGLNESDSALIYARKAYQLFIRDSSLTNNANEGTIIKSIIYTTLGDAFGINKEYDSALYYYQKSIPYSEAAEMQTNKIDAYNGIAKAYNKKGKHDSALTYAKKVLHINGVAKRYPSRLLAAATILSEIYETDRRPDSSLKYMRLALSIKDSLYSREKTTAFQNILFKEKEKKKAIAAATEKLQNRYRMYFIIAFFVVLLIIAAIIMRNRRLKQLQNIRNSIADDLHDDIGSTLSSISIMNELAKAKSPEALPLLTSIGESTSAIQENMSDIVWTVNPNNDHFENVLQRMNLFATEISNGKDIELEFKTSASLNASRLTMKQRKNLYFFFKEAINNAAKHSDAKKIIVNIVKKDHQIEMNVSDDGSGFDTSAIFGGNGMNSLKKRAEELNGIYSINSQVSKGTTVQLRFKIT